MVIEILQNQIHGSKAKRSTGVGAAVVYSYPPGVGINEVCAGEGYVLNVTDRFVNFLRGDKVSFAAL
jgi:hypothetical protein